MVDLKKFESEVQYVTNRNGEKTAVIVPIEDFEELLEDVEDLVAAVERRDEPTVSHDELLAELKSDGLVIDICELLEKKAARRRRLARLPFEEKVEIVRRLQELSREIKESRDENEGLRHARESAAEG